MSLVEGHILETPFEMFLVQVVVILGLSKIMTILLKAEYVFCGGYRFSFKQPAVVAEMLTGIVLGPTVLGRVDGFSAKLFPSASVTILKVIANFGLCLFMFLVGMELDPAKLKADLRLAAWIGFNRIVVAFAVSFGLAVYFNSSEYTGAKGNFTTLFLFIGSSMGISALPVLARVLSDKKLLNTRLGNITMSIAALDDITGYILIAIVTTLANAKDNIAILYTFLISAAEVLLVVFVLRPIVRLVFVERGEAQGGIKALSGDMFLIIFIILIALSWLTEAIGLSELIGAFQLGLIIPRESKIAERLSEKLEYFVVCVLMPLYFTNSGLRTQFGLVSTGEAVGVVLLLVVVSTVSTTATSIVLFRGIKMPFRMSAVIGVLLSCKGLITLIIVNKGLDLGIITPKFFAILVLYVLITTMQTIPLVNVIDPESRKAQSQLEAAAFESALTARETEAQDLFHRLKKSEDEVRSTGWGWSRRQTARPALLTDGDLGKKSSQDAGEFSGNSPSAGPGGDDGAGDDSPALLPIDIQVIVNPSSSMRGDNVLPSTPLLGGQQQAGAGVGFGRSRAGTALPPLPPPSPRLPVDTLPRPRAPSSVAYSMSAMTRNDVASIPTAISLGPTRSRAATSVSSSSVGGGGIWAGGVGGRQRGDSFSPNASRVASRRESMDAAAVGGGAEDFEGLGVPTKAELAALLDANATDHLWARGGILGELDVESMTRGAGAARGRASFSSAHDSVDAESKGRTAASEGMTTSNSALRSRAGSTDWDGGGSEVWGGAASATSSAGASGGVGAVGGSAQSAPPAPFPGPPIPTSLSADLEVIVEASDESHQLTVTSTTDPSLAAAAATMALARRAEVAAAATASSVGEEEGETEPASTDGATEAAVTDGVSGALDVDALSGVTPPALFPSTSDGSSVTLPATTVVAAALSSSSVADLPSTRTTPSGSVSAAAGEKGGALVRDGSQHFHPVSVRVVAARRPPPSRLRVLLAVTDTVNAAGLVTISNLFSPVATPNQPLHAGMTLTIAWLQAETDMPSSYMNSIKTVDDIRDPSMQIALSRSRAFVHSSSALATVPHFTASTPLLNDAPYEQAHADASSAPVNALEISVFTSRDPFEDALVEARTKHSSIVLVSNKIVMFSQASSSMLSSMGISGLFSLMSGGEAAAETARRTALDPSPIIRAVLHTARPCLVAVLFNFGSPGSAGRVLCPYEVGSRMAVPAVEFLARTAPDDCEVHVVRIERSAAATRAGGAKAAGVDDASANAGGPGVAGAAGGALTSPSRRNSGSALASADDDHHDVDSTTTPSPQGGRAAPDESVFPDAADTATSRGGGTDAHRPLLPPRALPLASRPNTRHFQSSADSTAAAISRVLRAHAGAYPLVVLGAQADIAAHAYQVLTPVTTEAHAEGGEEAAAAADEDTPRAGVRELPTGVTSSAARSLPDAVVDMLVRGLCEQLSACEEAGVSALVVFPASEI